MVDTNLVISSEMTTDGAPAKVLDAWRAGLTSLVTSQDLVDEMNRVVTRLSLHRRYRFDPERIAILLAALRASVIEPLPVENLPLRCRDPKDDAVLACALAAEADYIVTGDNDLLVLDGEPALGELRIVTPRRFLEILGSDR